MRETKVQPFASFVSRGVHVFHLLLGSQSVPLAVTLLVAPGIVTLVEQVEENV